MTKTIPQLTVIDIEQETADVSSYKNIPLSLLNDHVVRVGVMTEPFYWHYHQIVMKPLWALKALY